MNQEIIKNIAIALSEKIGVKIPSTLIEKVISHFVDEPIKKKEKDCCIIESDEIFLEIPIRYPIDMDEKGNVKININVTRFERAIEQSLESWQEGEIDIMMIHDDESVVVDPGEVSIDITIDKKEKIQWVG